ncbi:DNRLRE domain-containing protein [Nocardioides sp. CPCC 206347]|uniref:DNRLRE domain-containing protein n=1 Tax=unclassified Nocardioides TaxID=2615069 RepID=UPI0036202939
MSRRIWLGSITSTAAIGLVAAMTSGALAASPAQGVAVLEEPVATHTVTLDLTGDTWVSNIGQTASQATSPELRVGSANLGITKARSYLDFDYSALADIPADAVVQSAALTLSNFETGSCAGSAIKVSRVTGLWTVPGLTWTKQPTVTTTGAATSVKSYGATGCPTEGVVAFDATAIVNSWLSGGAQRGVQVAAVQEGAKTGFRKYRSAENGVATKAATITVTYNSYPATPEELAIEPESEVVGLVPSLAPTFSAELSDPEGDAVHALFEVRKGNNVLAPLVWSGASEPVASGETASATMPAGVLLDGTIYTVLVHAHDGTLKSKAKIYKVFKVDVTAPEVTITSDTLTNGQWTNPTPASAKVTLNGSADTAGFYLTVDGQEAPAVGANASGDYATTITPTAGWHTFEVTPVDKAGNLGATVTFSYGTGAPTFTAPSVWESSTADFAVSVDAPAGATGATLQWRVWGQGAWQTATKVDKGEAAWDGAVTTDGGRATTGLLTWHAALEAPATRPLALQVRACFTYAAGPSCTAERFVVLDEED